jgi:CHAT domain-containing protein/Tfp pilus assembly protein PilF
MRRVRYKWLGKISISKPLILFCIFIFSTSVYAQNTHPNTIQQWYREAVALYDLDDATDITDERALKLFLAVASSTHPKVDNSLKVESLIKAGNIHQSFGRYKDCNILYHRAIQQNMQSNPRPELDYEAFLYLGSSMYFNGILDSAKYYFEKTAEISVAYRDRIKLPEQDRLYNSLGAIYYEAADYKQAKKFFETALELASPRIIDYHVFSTTINSNIANCLLKLKYYDSSIQIFRRLQPNDDQRIIIQRNLAHAYFEKGLYDSALALYKKISFPGGIIQIVVLNDLGRIYMQKGMLNDAKKVLDEAIRQNQNLKIKVKDKEEALTYLYSSELAQKQGHYKEALHWCNKAMNEVHLNFNSASDTDLPEDVSNTVSPITFYQILIYKAGLIYNNYLKDKDGKDLITALKTYEKAFETANFISLNFDNDDAKLFFLEDSKANYSQAIQIAYEAGKLDAKYHQVLLFILESYKGNILRQNLEYTKLKQKAGISDEIIEKENELKQLYAAYLTKLNMVTSEKESVQIQQKLSEIKLELSTIRKMYDTNEIFSWIRKSMDNNIPLKTLQNTLDRKTALLNYFISKKDIYILVATRTNVKVEKIPITGLYQEALNVYLKESLRIREGQRYNGYNASNTVFNSLILPVYPEIASSEKIIIIPDDYLFYLPFDALIKTKETKDYMIYHHSISFHYSVSLLLRKQENPLVENASDSIIAFAPFANATPDSRNETNLLLPFSRKEISNPMTAAFLNADATKEKFLGKYSRYNIIHLATHASLGNDSSSNWIQFFPGSDAVASNRLYVHEIYNLQMDANNLVILSACESGAGLTTEGEGLLSLSRAFMYAGADGIISTLYKTDDRVTAYLMERLYHYMGKGFDPKEALRKSKIDLLRSPDINSRVKSPNYWSNFVYIGKINPSGEGFNPLWLLLISIIPLTYFGFKFSKRKPDGGNLN